MRQHEPRWQNALKLSSDSGPFSSPVHERGVLVPASFLGPFLCSALDAAELCVLCAAQRTRSCSAWCHCCLPGPIYTEPLPCAAHAGFTLLLNVGCALNPFRFEKDPHIENISISPAASRGCWSSVQALLL